MTMAENQQEIEVPLRLALRRATDEVHSRLHQHEGFAAIQSTKIEAINYKDLLMRLYGFYLPFENKAGAGRDRTLWLDNDLRAVGMDLSGITVPMCPNVPRMDNPGRRLGAHYVVEGSALGGRELAGNLDCLLGIGVTRGRSFFLGRGAGTAGAWRGYLDELLAVPREQAARAEVIGGATETFAVFEEWLNGWKNSPHD